MSYENPSSLSQNFSSHKKDYHLPEPENSDSAPISTIDPYIPPIPENEKRSHLSEIIFQKETDREKRYPSLITKILFGHQVKNSPEFLAFWQEVRRNNYLANIDIPNRLEEHRPHQLEEWNSPLFLFILEQKFLNKVDIAWAHHVIEAEDAPANSKNDYLKQKQLYIALQEALNGAQQYYENVLVPLVDQRTGLWNHHTFNQYLSLLSSPDIQKEQLDQHIVGYTYVMLDIDHFKQVNDNYGHLAGDQILKTLAQNLKNNPVMRSGDLAFRYGGEEFGLLLPITDQKGNHNLNDPQNNQVLFDRLLDILRPLSAQLQHIKLEDQDVAVNVTFSAGAHLILIQDIKSQDLSQLQAQFVTQADQNLYAAKESGRNRLIFKTPDGQTTFSEPIFLTETPPAEEKA